MLEKSEFLQYAATFGKSYSSTIELERRAEIFIANDKMIREWNAENNGTVMGHNTFSDWDHHEYQKLLRKTTSTSQGD